MLGMYWFWQNLLKKWCVWSAVKIWIKAGNVQHELCRVRTDTGIGDKGALDVQFHPYLLCKQLHMVSKPFIDPVTLHFILHTSGWKSWHSTLIDLPLLNIKFYGKSCSHRSDTSSPTVLRASALSTTWVQVPGQTPDVRCLTVYEGIYDFSGVWGLVSAYLSIAKPQNAGKDLCAALKVNWEGRNEPHTNALREISGRSCNLIERVQ